MRGSKRFALVAVILFFALAVMAFVLENQQGVVLSFLGWSTPELPVSVIAALALVAGMLIGFAPGLIFGRKKTR
jgi:uncharacterized integral membrane protein